VAIDSADNVYVADTYNHRIQKFDSDGTFLTKWGSSGAGDGQFRYPKGVAVDSADNVYVADAYNHRIQKFGEDKLGNPFIHVYIDIKPQSSLNPLNVNSKGVLPVAILGTESLDVTTIDTTTIKLSLDESEGTEGPTPIRWSYEDVASPLEEELYGSYELGPDGYEDLTLKFRTQTVVQAIGKVNDGEELVLTLSGSFLDGTEFEGADSIKIIKKGRKKKRGKK
jgi:hypothetical protein